MDLDLLIGFEAEGNVLAFDSDDDDFECLAFEGDGGDLSWFASETEHRFPLH